MEINWPIEEKSLEVISPSLIEFTTPSLIEFTTPSDTEKHIEMGPVTVDLEGDGLGQLPAVGGKDESTTPSSAELPDISATHESSKVQECLPSLETDEGNFQVEVNRWEEFYDQMHKFLLHDKKVSIRGNKNITRAAEHYSLGSDGNIYYCKLAKEGTTLARLLVVRDYLERVKICRSIHLDTGHAHLHNRRDKMLDLIGRKYFWKGQRRDICQCIASCEVCSIGLGAKRKTKPPAQKRDVPHGGPPQRKKARVDKTKPSCYNGGRSARSEVYNNRSNPCKNGKSSAESTSVELVIGSSDRSIGRPLSDLTGAIQARTEEWVEELQPVLLNLGNGEVDGARLQHKPRSQSSCGTAEENVSSQRSTEHLKEVPVLYVGPAEDVGCLKQSAELQLYTEEDRSSDQAVRCALDVEEESPHGSPPGDTENKMEDVSIYKLLFNVPSVSSCIFPSVVEAVHLGMKETADFASCLDAFDTIMRQIFSLGPEHSIIITPCPASAYCVAIFACMMAVDPLSVTSQVCSRNLPLAVIHDACCAHFQHHSSRSRSELGLLKTGTSLTGCYNWNLGDAVYPMDREALRSALQSNRVAAVLYQPYAYAQQSPHLSLKDVSRACHSQGSAHTCNVSVVVDGTDMLSHISNVGDAVVPEMKFFLEQGADVVLMQPLDKLGGVSRSCVLVGAASLLGCVRESMTALQSQVCLPLFCQPHDLVDAIVTYKALQDS